MLLQQFDISCGVWLAAPAFSFSTLPLHAPQLRSLVSTDLLSIKQFGWPLLIGCVAEPSIRWMASSACATSSLSEITSDISCLNRSEEEAVRSTAGLVSGFLENCMALPRYDFRPIGGIPYERGSCRTEEIFSR